MNARSPHWALVTTLLVTALAGMAGPALAATKVEGFYQLMTDLRKNDRPYLWEFDTNNNDTWNGATLWAFSTPARGIESFIKFEAAYRSDNDNYPAAQFQYREADLRFHKEFGKRGFDSYVFSRQDRFWSNTYLVNWVNGHGDYQGIRLDGWGLAKTNIELIAADQSGNYNPQSTLSNHTPAFPYSPVDSIARQDTKRTPDEYVVRLRRDFLKDNALRLGMTYTRVEGWQGTDSTSGISPWNAVLGFDSRLRVNGTDFSLEYGESRDDARHIGYIRSPEFTLGGRPMGFRLPDRAVIQAEIRSLRLGTAKTGYLSIAPAWWSRGPKWSDYAGGPNNDETGFYINTYYLLPERAITFTNNLLWYGPHANVWQQTRDVYSEIYVEFINGFTGKTYYRHRDIFRDGAVNGMPVVLRETHLYWFNELQVESRLAWMRVQTKFTDIGNIAKKELYVIEASINLSQKTKVYNRYAFGNDPSILRKGILTQLQYRPSGNVEMFLQYGPDWIGGGSSPVDEGNLNGSSDQRDLIKFILKGSF